MKKIIALIATLIVLLLGVSAMPAQAALCSPQDAYTETIEHPAVTHVVHHDAVTHDVKVIDQPAQHYSEAHNEGNDPLGNDEVPPTPLVDPSVWQANTEQEPHLNNPNVTWLNSVGVGLHYMSHGSSGRRDWFYFAPEQSHTETVVDVEAYDETVVDKEAWTETIEHEAVVCTDTPNEPNEPSSPDKPDNPDTPTVPDKPDTPNDPAEPNKPAPPVTTVLPNGGMDDTNYLPLGLAILLILAGGGILAVRKRA